MKLIDILVRYRIVSFIPMEKTTFSSVVLPKNIKLSQELVKINYSKLSSIKNPEILYTIEGKQINLWFFEKNRFQKTFIVIPESYFILKSLKELRSAIVIFKTDPVKVFVIKDNQYKVAAIIKKNENLFIELAQIEHTISKTVYFDSKDYKKMYAAQRQDIGVKDLYQFIQWDMIPKNIGTYILDKLTYPIVFFVTLFIFITYMQTVFMENKVERLTKEYQEIKKKNQPIKRAIRVHNNEIKLLNTLVSEELTIQDPVAIVFSMYDVFYPEDNTTIRQFNFEGNICTLQIESFGNPVKYLNRLNKTGYFSNVIIKDSIEKKEGKKIFVYDLSVKELDDEY